MRKRQCAIPTAPGAKKSSLSILRTSKSAGASAVNAIEAAIKLLRHPQEFGAISSNYLPYVPTLPAFAALQSHVKSLPPNLSTRRTTEKPSLVLGIGVPQPLFWFCRIHHGPRLS